MSQDHIRRGAGMGWIRRAAMQLHEPRIVSAVYGAAYTLSAIVGLITIFYPPLTFEGLVGQAIMSYIGAAIAAGGILGMVTIIKGCFWVERYAVGLITAGLGFHLLLTIIATIMSLGNRQLTIMALTFAIGFILMRSIWIFKSPYRLVHGKDLHR